MTNKLIALTLALTFILAFVGCTADPAVTPSTETKSASSVEDFVSDAASNVPSDQDTSDVTTESTASEDQTDPASDADVQSGDDETSEPDEQVSSEDPVSTADTPSAQPDPSSVDPDHVHSYTTSVVAATCTKDGYTLHKCECGVSYKTDTVAAAGHDYRETTTVLSTCTKEGYTLYTCKTCGATKKDDKTEKIDHSWGLKDTKIEGSTKTVYYECHYCGKTREEKSTITVQVDENYRSLWVETKSADNDKYVSHLLVGPNGEESIVRVYKEDANDTGISTVPSVHDYRPSTNLDICPVRVRVSTTIITIYWIGLDGKQKSFTFDWAGYPDGTLMIGIKEVPSTTGGIALVDDDNDRVYFHGSTSRAKDGYLT